MYVSTPYGRVVALDSATGKEVWVYQLPSGQPSTRGVEYRPGDAALPPQIVFGSSEGQLFSLHAKTGKTHEAFGDKGIVNLNTPEILQGSAGNNGLSSPPVVYRNLIITGGRTQESPGTGPRGRRAGLGRAQRKAGLDVSLRAAGWREIQRDVGGRQLEEPLRRQRLGFDDRRCAARHRLHAVWRAGNRSLRRRQARGQSLQLQCRRRRCAHGKYLWHFQVVRHDIWDADVATPPILLDVRQQGRTIPAVGVMSKSGLLFLLDRVNGKPIYGVEERPVPQSEVPLERTARTQPFPVKPPPLSRMTMTAGRHRHRHAGTGSRVPQDHGGHSARRSVSAGWLQPAAAAVPRQSRRRELGRRVVQSAARIPVRQHERARAAPGICRSRADSGRH